MNEPRPFRLNYRHPLAKGLVAFGIEDGELEKPDPAMVELVAELEQAQAVVDKLPTYADTGEQFVAEYDDAWVFSDGRARKVLGAACCGPASRRRLFVVTVDGCGSFGPAYSTQAAAQAARKVG